MRARGSLLVVMVSTQMLAGLAAAQSPGAEPARNKEVARRFLEEAFGPHWRVELVDELHLPEFVLHTAHGDLGLREDREAVLAWQRGTPDLTIRIEDIVAEDERVAVRWTASGTNSGEWNGLPATGKKVTATGMTFWRFKDGKIAEEWGLVDMLSVLRQLGQLPEATRTKSP
jgi:steroid delta-isomerase-like uncharacterized protein